MACCSFRAAQLPLLYALLAAALLHGGVWWAWPRSGVLGSPVSAFATAKSSVRDVGVHRVSLLSMAKTVISNDAASVEPPESVGGELKGRVAEHGFAGADAWMASIYRDASELDQSALPLADWVLDEEALQGLPHTLIQLRLKVSAGGQIDHVEVLKSDPPGRWVLVALRRLSETPMQAGLRDGKPVASTLVVELATENERVH